jgi:hypothetical protein
VGYADPREEIAQEESTQEEIKKGDISREEELGGRGSEL